MTQSIGKKKGSFKHFESPVVFDGLTIGSTSVDISNDTLGKALNALYWRIFIEQVTFGAILGLIVYLFTARGIVSPIRKLTMAMEEAVEKGNSFVARDLEVKSRDEIGRLVVDDPAYDSVRKLILSYQK